MRVEPSVPGDVLSRVLAPFEAAGGQRIDAPLLQPLNLLLDLAGEAMRAIADRQCSHFAPAAPCRAGGAG